MPIPKKEEPKPMKESRRSSVEAVSSLQEINNQPDKPQPSTSKVNIWRIEMGTTTDPRQENARHDKPLTRQTLDIINKIQTKS